MLPSRLLLNQFKARVVSSLPIFRNLGSPRITTSTGQLSFLTNSRNYSNESAAITQPNQQDPNANAKANINSSGKLLTVTIPTSAFETSLKVPFPIPSDLASLSSSSPASSSSSASALPSTKISELPNRVKVCSIEATSQTSMIGVLFDLGPRYETELDAGSSQLLRLLAFTRTKNRDVEKMGQDLAELGSQFYCLHSRENIIYNACVYRHQIPQALDLLADTLRNPNFTLEDVEEQKQSAFYEFEALVKKPELLMIELAHISAFHSIGLGNMTVSPPEKIDLLTLKSLKEFTKSHLSPSRIIVGAVGSPHEELVDLAYKAFGDMKETIPLEKTKKPARYIGGDFIFPDQTADGAHFTLSFEAVPFSHPDLYAYAILQLLLGGGGSFSAGGPGKGMYSRLYVNVLNRYPWIKTAQAFNNNYSDTGLFSLYIACEPDHLSDSLSVILSEMIAVTSQISESELQRAKNQLKSALLMNLESKHVQLEDLIKQIQILGRRIESGEMLKLIDQVTVKDMLRITKKMFSSAPSASFYGQVPQDISVSNNVAKFLQARIKK